MGVLTVFNNYVGFFINVYHVEGDEFAVMVSHNKYKAYDLDFYRKQDAIAYAHALANRDEEQLAFDTISFNV